MSGSGAQLVLMLFAEHEDKKHVANDAPAAVAVDADHEVPPADAANANVVPLATKAAAS